METTGAGGDRREVVQGRGREEGGQPREAGGVFGQILSPALEPCGPDPGCSDLCLLFSRCRSEEPQLAAWGLSLPQVGAKSTSLMMSSSYILLCLGCSAGQSQVKVRIALPANQKEKNQRERETHAPHRGQSHPSFQHGHTCNAAPREGNVCSLTPPPQDAAHDLLAQPHQCCKVAYTLPILL